MKYIGVTFSIVFSLFFVSPVFSAEKENPQTTCSTALHELESKTKLQKDKFWDEHVGLAKEPWFWVRWARKMRDRDQDIYRRRNGHRYASVFFSDPSKVHALIDVHP